MILFVDKKKTKETTYHYNNRQQIFIDTCQIKNQRTNNKKQKIRHDYPLLILYLNLYPKSRNIHNLFLADSDWQ